MAPFICNVDTMLIVMEIIVALAVLVAAASITELDLVPGTVYICICTRIWICIGIYVHVLCLCMYVYYVYILYIYTYIYTHTDTHTNFFLLSTLVLLLPKLREANCLAQDQKGNNQ